MNNFNKIKEALEYIDAHLEETITIEILSEKFYFSPYYFHRIFSSVVGKTIAAHIRDRRLMTACIQLSTTKRSILSISLDSGFNSTQSFSRTFNKFYRISPSEYRRQKLIPTVISIDELIMKFTNRLRGGIDLNPNIIKRNELIIAGTCGDGNETAEVWNVFEKLSSEKPLDNKLSDNGYEIRTYDGDISTVYTGFAVSDENIDSDYTIFKLPPSKYASFDVYVANGYESENNAMDEWLKTNTDGYSEKLLDTQHYCVEFYDERFRGDESGSVVEIWIPIEKI